MGANTTREFVVRELEGLGFQVVSVGSRSISIEGTRRRFETVFQLTWLPPTPRPPGPTDFGAVVGPTPQPAQPPMVPVKLRDAVDTIEIQEPPVML